MEQIVDTDLGGLIYSLLAPLRQLYSDSNAAPLLFCI